MLTFGRQWCNASEAKSSAMEQDCPAMLAVKIPQPAKMEIDRWFCFCGVQSDQRADHVKNRLRLKFQGQVKLHQLIMFNGVDLGNVLITAASAEFVVNPCGETVTDGANQGAGESVTEGAVESLQIAAAFKEVRVNQIGVERVLLHMLPIDARFPSASSEGRAIDQPQVVAVADRQANLVGFVLVSLQGDAQGSGIN